MTDRQVGNPIDLDVVERQRKQTGEQVEAIQTMLQGELDYWLPTFGKLMLGMDKKVVTDENGRRKRVPITMADIDEHMDRMQLEAEEEARQALVKKTQFALEAQSRYFDRSKSESRRSQSQATANFARALIARFEALPLPNCGWEWQEKEPTFARDEKTLEEFCNITLEDTPAKYSNRNADLIPSAQALDTRNPSTWNAIVRKQSALFKGYIEDIVKEKARSASGSADVASRLTRGEEPVYTQEQVDSFTEYARTTDTQAREVVALQGFGEILPYFQAKIGKPITFHELLVPESQN